MEVINPLRFLKDQTSNAGDPEIKKLVLAIDKYTGFTEKTVYFPVYLSMVLASGDKIDLSKYAQSSASSCSTVKPTIFNPSRLAT